MAGSEALLWRGGHVYCSEPLAFQWVAAFVHWSYRVMPFQFMFLLPLRSPFLVYKCLHLLSPVPTPGTLHALYYSFGLYFHQEIHSFKIAQYELQQLPFGVWQRFVQLKMPKSRCNHVLGINKSATISTNHWSNGNINLTNRIWEDGAVAARDSLHMLCIETILGQVRPPAISKVCMRHHETI